MRGGTPLELHVISHEHQTVLDLIRCWQPIAPWVDAFHVRYKNKSEEQVNEIVQQLRSSRAIPFSKLMINRYQHVATQFDCAGLHLPEYQKIDKGWIQANRRDMRVGRSVHSLEGARKAEIEGMDYIMVGHIFPSPSKPDLPPLGVDRLSEIVKSVQIPVIAIGGIGVDQVDEVIRIGCAGIAVISAVSQHHSPLQVVQELKRSGKSE